MELTAISKGRNTYRETIVEWFEGRIKEEELSPAVLEYWERVQTCHASQLAMHSKTRTVRMLMKRYDIHQATAYRLYTDTEYIIGSQRKSNTEFKRLMAEEMAKATYRKAKKANSTSLMIKALHAYIRATGIELENSDMPDFEKLDPAQILVVLPEQLEQNLLAQLAQGVINLNEAPEAIDITPHQEVDNG